jgi:outer membrane lipase/esterase
MSINFLALVLVMPVCSFSLPITVDQLVVFGDSLSDNGNAAIVLGGTLPGNYAPNAFTDGPATIPSTAGPFGLWIDQFAMKTGLPDPQPYLANPLSNTNYAVASAQTGSANPQDVSNQVAAFSLAHGGSAPANALYILWAGANDLYNATNSGKTAADNLAANIQALSSEGAKYFLWLNLPQLGSTPRGAGSAALNIQSAAFDSEWSSDIVLLNGIGIDVTGIDVNSLFSQILMSPASFGFSNVISPAQGISGNPNTYLFWDIEHPTTAGDALIAGVAFNGAVATPEPGSWGLLLIGVVSLLIVGGVRSRAGLAKSLKNGACSHARLRNWDRTRRLNGKRLIFRGI